MERIVNRDCTADNLTSCDGGHQFGTAGMPKSGQAQVTLLGEATHKKGLRRVVSLSVGYADALPSKEARID